MPTHKGEKVTQSKGDMKNEDIPGLYPTFGYLWARVRNCFLRSPFLSTRYNSVDWNVQGRATWSVRRAGTTEEQNATHMAETDGSGETASSAVHGGSRS